MQAYTLEYTGEHHDIGRDPTGLEGKMLPCAPSPPHFGDTALRLVICIDLKPHAPA